jgi:hypothetical protein
MYVLDKSVTGCCTPNHNDDLETSTTDCGRALKEPRSGTYIVLIILLLILGRRGLIEKLTVAQLVKKFPALYGKRRFLLLFVKAHHTLLS